MSAALDACIASYEFDAAKQFQPDVPLISNSSGEAAIPPLEVAHQKLRQRLASQFKNALDDFRSGWLNLLSTTLQSNRNEYKFRYISGCDAEADSLARSIISNIGKSSNVVFESPVLRLYSLCVLN